MTRFPSLTRFVLHTLAPVLMTTSPLNAQTSPVPPGQHGAAYQTTKGTFFGAGSSTVTGVSTELSASVSWSPERDRFRIQAAVPAQSLRSGIGRRDRHVAELLGAPDHPAVRFATGWVSVTAFRQAVASGAARVPGQLSIDGRAVPVEFVLRRAMSGGHPVLDGQLSTTFDAVGVEVPNVAGGLVASAGEDLDLFVRVRLDQLAGGDGLLD